MFGQKGSKIRHISQHKEVMEKNPCPTGRTLTRKEPAELGNPWRLRKKPSRTSEGRKEKGKTVAMGQIQKKIS